MPRQVTHQERIYRRLVDTILKGGFGAAGKLPSSRELSEQLNVSRTTIMEVYDRLTGEGLIQGRRGSGMYVVEGVRIDTSQEEAPKSEIDRRSSRARAFDQLGSSSLLRETPTRPFRMGVAALEIFPFAIWNRLLTKHIRAQRARHFLFSNTQGDAELRKSIAIYLASARGVVCDPSQVIVTSGIQHALGLLAYTLADFGDSVGLEEPGYIAARLAFQKAGLNVLPCPVDKDGLDPKQLPRDELRFLFVTPSHQYPLGMTLPLARRQQLLETARKRGMMIIEDDYNAELRMVGQPVPSLQGLDAGNGSVIYVGSFSKVMFSALRVGYAVVPPWLVSSLVLARSLDGVHSCPIEQAALSDFIREGHLGRHVRRCRREYRRRFETVKKLLSETLPRGFTVADTTTGMHTVLYGPSGFDDRHAARDLAENGVDVSPLSRYFVGKPSKRGLILGFSGFTPSRLREACRTLVGRMRNFA